MKLTSSIVTYNTKQQDFNLVVNSLFKNKSECILYIIDNSPTDTIRSWCNDSRIIYIFNNSNLGYGAAHNIAIKKAIEIGSNYHIVLNPDISFDENVISSLTNYAEENKDIVYLLPKVVFPNGELQYLCKLLPTPFNLIFRRFLPKNKYSEKINDRYILKHSGYDKIINPPCLSGCFMFLRVSALQEHNIFFDDSFFMYCEDFDIIRRLHRIGKTVYFPEISIVHNHAKESYKSKKMLIEHIKSACKYFNKYGWFFDKERKKMNKQILTEINNYSQLSQ